MFRFETPDSSIDSSRKREAFLSQLEDFLHDEALQELLQILNVDIATLGQVYNARALSKGSVVETQEIQSSEVLKDKKEILYPLFKELGFFDINTPRWEKNSRVIVLGGSLNACNKRTECAKKWIDETTAKVDGLTCFRPIGSAERRIAPASSCETETGAMADSFARVFDLNPQNYTETFTSDRNLNSISCIRIFSRSDGRNYRIFSAPSSEPHLRRADTADTLRFYFENDELMAHDESALFITNNRHCNRQFLQLSYCMIERGYSGMIDVIGCSPDDDIVTADTYDPLQYLQDLIGITDWINRFKKLI